ncbi:hypothetical protein NEMIN01_1682 [Nematocida minor]|uniref:uncharacterized protein n=1 Tax=Nematocida minor TaxID=1912983 RepID=UPI0022207362|nr:uncharacterized protein NEMIN01_1682 [Nematocida minor]KAI5191827.1 hypothetical protein NEMIN01_1682 [Nematocida minor]
MSEWIPPKRLGTSKDEPSLSIATNYPANYSNNINNTVYNIPLINVTRQNYIPNIRYTALLDNEIVNEINTILNTIE